MTADDLHAPLDRHGVLDPYAERFSALDGPVRIEVLPAGTQWNLRVDGADAIRAVEAVLGAPLPGPLSATTTPDGTTAVWLGPDEWLLLAPPGGPEPDAAALRDAIGDGGALVDQSGYRVGLRLRGDVAGLLAKGTSVDLRPHAFGAGAAVQTLLAQSVVVLVARSPDVREADLLVRTSFARSAADWLLDALRDPLAVPAADGG